MKRPAVFTPTKQKWNFNLQLSHNIQVNLPIRWTGRVVGGCGSGCYRRCNRICSWTTVHTPDGYPTRSSASSAHICTGNLQHDELMSTFSTNFTLSTSYLVVWWAKEQPLPSWTEGRRWTKRKLSFFYWMNGQVVIRVLPADCADRVTSAEIL